jgi:hypothetical protein
MDLKGSMKSYERYIFEEIYSNKMVNEGSTTSNYMNVGFYTKKICEIIPEMKNDLGKMYEELDILDFIYHKNIEQKFTDFVKNINENSDVDITELIAHTDEVPIVMDNTDIYVIQNVSKLTSEIFRPTSNETLQKAIEGIGMKVRNLTQINFKVYIKVFDSKAMEEIQPKKLILLDITNIVNRFKGEEVTKKKSPRQKRYRSYVTRTDMDVCKDEKNVQENYGSTLRNYDFVQTGAILRTDNIYSFKTNNKEYHLLAEFKFGKSMKSEVHFAQIIAQCLAYLKLIEKSGNPIPEIILCGDENECCVFSYELVLPYMNVPDVKWDAKPSAFLQTNQDLFMKLVNSDLLKNIFIYDIDDKFEFKTVVTKIKDLAKSSVTKTKINPKNMSTAFHYFVSRVLHKDVTLSANEKVNLFIQILVNPDDNYLHPTKSEIVSKHFGTVKVDKRQFTSFMSNYEGFSYTIDEKEQLVGVSDMIILEEDRRKQGEYFTPDILTLKADEYLSWYLGDDYKDQYFVWDCAAGTGNLTRNFKYTNLYQSTLHKSDLQTMKQSGINPEATKFQFDFLNDDLDKLPNGLMEAIKENKKRFIIIPDVIPLISHIS